MPVIDFAGLGGGWNGARRFQAEKTWRFVGVFGPEVIIGATVVQTGLAGNVFAYVFERESRTLHHVSLELPSVLGGDVDLSPGRERIYYSGRGLDLVCLTSADGSVHLDVRGDVDVAVSLAPPSSPLVLVSRVPEAGLRRDLEGVNVTRKMAGMACRGTARLGEKVYDLGASYGIVDDTHGLMARETKWRWASASGMGGSETVWGLNLVEGHNDYEWTENGVWKNGELTYVGHAIFDYPDDPMEPWAVRTEDGSVDLTFTPEGMRKGDIDMKLLASTYRAPLGTYSGTLLGESVTGLVGMAENHTARW